MRGSSFQDTDLDYQLRQRGIDRLVIGGLTANTCMEATSRYAHELWVKTGFSASVAEA